MIYVITSKIKAVFRRLRLSHECNFKPYNNPQAVGGWLGCYVDKHNNCVAFLDVDYRIKFDW